MAFTIKIDGTDRTSSIELRTLVFNDDIEVRGDSINLDVFVQGTSWRPEAGNTVEVLENGTRIFFGHSLTPEQKLVNPDVFKYSINAVNTVWLMNRKLLAKSFPSQDAGAMIKAIVDSTAAGELSLVADGFTYTNVQSSFVIPEIDFDYVSVSNAFDTIAGMVGYQWYIDEFQDIHFFSLESNTAPVSQISASTTDIWNLSINEDVSQIKNRVFVKDFSARAAGGDEIDTSYTGDGISKFFPLGTSPWDETTDSISVKINGTAIGTQLLDGADSVLGDSITATDTIYICPDNWGARFPDGSPLGSGDKLDIAIKQYEAENQIVMVEDPVAQAEQQARENSADGVHEYVVSRPDLRAPTTDVAEQFGELVLRRYKNPILYGEFETWQQGWRPGQVFQINWPERNFNNEIVYVISIQERYLRAGVTNDREVRVRYSSTPYEII
jgi:hypothetical protein